jgi:uncharacterized membrane protein YphA (DoxX/SURF4 family)
MEYINLAGWLALRLGVGLLFLNAAWACGKNAAARQWTIEETAILFRPPLAKPFALIGIGVMGLGGLLVLLGLFGRVGGLMLAGFLVPGAVIHFRKRNEADVLAAELRPLTTVPDRLDVLHVSARLGHHSSALKNLALVGVTLFMAAVGTGPWSMDRLLFR